ncbi:bile acid:sodium symporter family protein [Pontibacter pudoricolor]|uniref:bile acid:sodium symporter family protein n=1 Tax=Pontibacter pudoricolor TaxID=2694930 RepID=UPI001390AB35|nr:bile acid:sodium symporter [Pontibacter pudoricolor]
MDDFLTRFLNFIVPVFSVLSMFSAGLPYTMQEIVEPLKNRKGVILALMANFLLVPALTILIIKVFSLHPTLEAGLILAACGAGAPFLIQLAGMAKVDVALAATCLILLLPATALFMPLVVPMALPEANVSAWSILEPLLLTMLLPLAAGMLLKGYLPEWAQLLQPWAAKLSGITLVLLFLTSLVLYFGTVIALFGSGAILAAIVFVLGCYGIGYLIAWSPGIRHLIGLATAQRNIAAATVVATLSFESRGPLVMVIIISLISMAILFPLAWWLGKRKQNEITNPDINYGK